MAPNYRQKPKEVCHEIEIGGEENYEAWGAINCVEEKLNFIFVAKHAGEEGEKSEIKPSLPGINLKIVDSDSSTTNYFYIMDH